MPYNYLHFLLPGTVQSNRKDLPIEFKSKVKKPAGTIETFRDGDIMALARGKLSTKHTANTVSVQSRYMILYYITIIIILLHILRRTSAMKEKPAVIADYNTYMLGVDKMDQLVSYCSFTYKCKVVEKFFLVTGGRHSQFIYPI